MKKLLCVILALAMLTGCGNQNELPTEELVEVPTEELLVEEELQLSVYEEDAMYLIEQVEALHPCFVMDDTPKNYDDVKMNYLEAMKHCTEYHQFMEETLRYISVLGDIHTNVGVIGLGEKILNLNSFWYEDTLWLEDETGLMTDIKILSIGGVEPSKLWVALKELFPFENESGYGFYKYHIVFDTVLSLAGVNVEQQQLEVVFEKNGNKYSEQRDLLTLSDWVVENPDTIFSQRPTATYKILDNVFYLDLNRFQVDSSLNKATDALKEAIANGTKKVIVDLRGNSGGNSLAGSQILKAMGMSEPAYSWYTRNKGSQIINKYEPLIENKGSANPNVDLIVLSDEITFSSGTMFCIWTQDGNLGKVIGRPSANSPNCYGDVTRGTLPNTKTRYQISFKQWKRPDANANPDIMELDVYVPADTDALSVALEMLAE